MSALKYQLKELVSSLSAEANQNKDKQVKQRFYLIKAVIESKKDVKKTCEARGVSTDQFYTWAKRLIEAKTLVGLKSLSKSAKSFWNKTPPRVEKRILKMRKAEPFLGPERISQRLKKKFNVLCPSSTVAAILKRSGLVTKEYSKQLTKKHIKRYRRPWPGYMQMDHKYVPFLLDRKQYYQLSAIDHHSSWRFIRVYPDRKTSTVIEFLNELQANAPFEIIQLQTDNAAEFTDKYTANYNPLFVHEVDAWCRQRQIEHKLIPIGQKELNGKVENTHKWDDREFFSQINPINFMQLQQLTKEHNYKWNEERETKTLGWQTPSEVIAEAKVRAFFYLKLHTSKTAWPKNGKSKRILTQSGAEIFIKHGEVKKIKQKLKPENKSKSKNDLDRYLQYLDWMDKKTIKSWAVPLILQNYSCSTKGMVWGSKISPVSTWLASGTGIRRFRAEPNS